jgi:hypothetical protein
MAGKVYKRIIDGRTYSTKFRMAVEGYEAPLFELQDDYGIKMTRKAWEKGIPGSCNNCAMVVKGRAEGLKAMWISRCFAYLLFKIPGSSTFAWFKARPAKDTRLAAIAHDQEKIDECPEGTFWFHAIPLGTMERQREKNRRYNATHEHPGGGYKPKKENIIGSHEGGEKTAEGEIRDARGRVRITEI